MNPILRNILSILAGFIGGSAVNMALISASGSIIPPPEGADLSTNEGLIASIHLFEPKHFIMPFLAHALGTFAGAYLAARIAASHKMTFALVIGFLFLLGGIGAVYMIPAPLWYDVIDLVLAYIPMAFIAGKFALRLK